MALSVRYCSGCRALTHPSQSACPSCGGTNFTNATVVDPNSGLSELEQTPGYVHLKSALGNSELYLRAIANFLSVIWLFFVASVVAPMMLFLANWTEGKYAECLANSYQSSSCDSYQYLTIGVYVVGGVATLVLLILAWDRGWLAYKSIRRAEKI